MRIPFTLYFRGTIWRCIAAAWTGNIKDRDGGSDEPQACSLDHTITDRILFCLGFVLNKTRQVYLELAHKSSNRNEPFPALRCSFTTGRWPGSEATTCWYPASTSPHPGKFDPPSTRTTFKTRADSDRSSSSETQQILKIPTKN
jgi:hypothetical protein